MTGCLTPQELADLLGVHLRTVLRWRDKGKLKIVKLSYKNPIIRPEEVERVVSEHKLRLESRLQRIKKGRI